MAGVIAFAIVPLAHGEVRTFVMEGNVTVIQNPTGALDFVHLGDRVVYTFTFDSNAPDLDPVPAVGEYTFLAGSLLVGSNPIPLTPQGILVGHPLDLFEVQSGAAMSGLTNTYARLTLDDQAESNALVDASLPVAPYDLALFQYKGFVIQGLGPVIPPGTYPSISNLEGSIDRFYAVPEASSVLLLCLGGLLLKRHS
jgi:hypothetical protein